MSFEVIYTKHFLSPLLLSMHAVVKCFDRIDWMVRHGFALIEESDDSITIKILDDSNNASTLKEYYKYLNSLNMPDIGSGKREELLTKMEAISAMDLLEVIAKL